MVLLSLAFAFFFRQTLEQIGQLEPRKSVLEDDFEDIEEEEQEQEQKKEQEREKEEKVFCCI